MNSFGGWNDDHRGNWAYPGGRAAQPPPACPECTRQAALQLCGPAWDDLSARRRAFLAEAATRAEGEEQFLEALDPLQNIFQGIVLTNVAGSSTIAIPPTWPSVLAEYGRSNPADGAIHASALARRPAFHRGGWILSVQTHAAAMTLDRDIFVSGSLSLATYAHELVHVHQYGYLGPTAFLASYFGLSAATIAYRLIRRAPLDAMRSSPHEAQAYALEGRFSAWYSSTYGASASSVTV
jgi:hypothetical protein